MRLDVYLAENDIASSRSKAKRAIKMGFVSVDGNIIKEPDHNVVEGQDIELENQKAVDYPAGYWKLKDLQEKTNCLEMNDVVLDLGSSAGGYILFASEIASKIYGVEISDDFKDELGKLEEENDNVEITFGNVLHLSPNSMASETVDVILNDLTLEPLISFRALEKVLPKLKRNGRILMTIKLQDMKPEEGKEMARRVCEMNNIEIKQFIESEDKDEMYMYAKNMS